MFSYCDVWWFVYMLDAIFYIKFGKGGYSLNYAVHILNYYRQHGNNILIKER